MAIENVGFSAWVHANIYWAPSMPQLLFCSLKIQQPMKQKQNKTKEKKKTKQNCPLGAYNIAGNDILGSKKWKGWKIGEGTGILWVSWKWHTEKVTLSSELIELKEWALELYRRTFRAKRM